MKLSLAAAAARLREGFSTGPLQWLCLAAAAPVLFVVPWWQPVYGICLLVAQQVLRCLDPAERRRALDLDVTWPALGLIGMALVGLNVSPDYERSLTQFVGVAFNLAVFTAVVSTMRRACSDGEHGRRSRMALAVFGGLGVLVAIAAFLRAMPRVSSFILVTALHDARPPVPRDLGFLLDVVVRPNMHPNLVAGTLVLFLPIYVALLLYRPWRRGEGGRAGRGWLLATVLALILTSVLFFATLSRGGFVALAISLCLLLAWQQRRSVRLRQALALGLVMAGALTAGTRLGAWPNPIVVASAAFDTMRVAPVTRTFGTRLDGWPYVVELIIQHPWTGLGLNQAPVFLLRLNRDFFHAHNLFLQIALDLGLPGLLLFVAQLAIVGVAVTRALRASEGAWHEALTVGLAAALVAHLIWSMADTVAQGYNPSVYLWVTLGLAAGLQGSRCGGLRAGGIGDVPAGSNVTTGSNGACHRRGRAHILAMRAQAPYRSVRLAAGGMAWSILR